MALVFVVSREPRMRGSVTEYLRDRGYDTATAENYDVAMETLPALHPSALVVDVQGVPRGDSGSQFPVFNLWLSTTYRSLNGSTRAPNLLYLLHKGSRRPNFRIEGTVIKKPFPIEALGEALRELLGLRPAPEFELWMESLGLMEDGRLTPRAGDPTVFDRL